MLAFVGEPRWGLEHVVGQVVLVVKQSRVRLPLWRLAGACLQVFGQCCHRVLPGLVLQSVVHLLHRLHVLGDALARQLFVVSLASKRIGPVVLVAVAVETRFLLSRVENLSLNPDQVGSIFDHPRRIFVPLQPRLLAASVSRLLVENRILCIRPCSQATDLEVLVFILFLEQAVVVVVVRGAVVTDGARAVLTT